MKAVQIINPSEMKVVELEKPHPEKTGVFRVSAYVANADGSIRTKTISFNIICAVSGTQEKLIAINNIADKATNWSENTLFEYTMYDGDNVSTNAIFQITKDSEVSCTVYTKAGVDSSVTSPVTFTMTLFAPEDKYSAMSTLIETAEDIYISLTTTYSEFTVFLTDICNSPLSPVFS